MTEEELTPLIKKYLEDGLSETEILKSLKENDGEVITFLDLQMILADLDEVLENENETIDDLNAEKAKHAAQLDKQRASSGATSVSLDEVPSAGSRMSGSAHLASGATINWALNGQGQLGLLPGGEGEPTEDDMGDFQRVLQAELQKKLTKRFSKFEKKKKKSSKRSRDRYSSSSSSDSD